MSEEQAIVSDVAAAPNAGVEGPLANGAGNYGEDNVQIFRDTAHIRQRPSMYIGNTSSSGLHHLVYELVYNSVDEALAGYCHNILVKIDVDKSISVGDDGRGIPIEEHLKPNRPTLQPLIPTPAPAPKS